MKHRLSENIRKYRKLKSLTQEQLAEAVGVTVGTVSKWENGNCLPDITMITEIADFYEISIDVLVGYDTPQKNVSTYIHRIDEYYKKHQLEDALQECNKALVKYPNNFDLLEKAARTYYVYNYDKKDPSIQSRTKALYEHALLNRPENLKTTKEIAIRHGLAMLEDDTDKKIELLRDININAIYNAEIGEVYRDRGNMEQAYEYFSEGLYMGIMETTNTIGHWFDALIKNNQIHTCLSLVEFCIDLMCKAYSNGERGIGAKFLSQIEVIHSVLLHYEKDAKKAAASINLAYQYALNFDKNPAYDLKTGATFWLGKKDEDLPIAFDEQGGAAVEGISRLLNDMKDEYKDNTKVTSAVNKSIRDYQKIKKAPYR